MILPYLRNTQLLPLVLSSALRRNNFSGPRLPLAADRGPKSYKTDYYQTVFAWKEVMVNVPLCVRTRIPQYPELRLLSLVVTIQPL
ncbi:MAG TPA: hypothetical protein VFB12_07080, partial [Ktedonobacteraceae bacterium]|nr:hypothetical protein [Ktedonobacteraceae bacterium]